MSKLTKIQNYLLVILGLIVTVQMVKAEQLEEPNNFFAKIMYQDGLEPYIHLQWFYYNVDEIDGFKLYRAEGRTKNIDEFSLYDTYPLGEEPLERVEKNIFVMKLENMDSVASYFVTAYKNENESENSNIEVVKERKNHKHYYIEVLNYPSETAVIGEEYSYTPEVETNIENPEYEFLLIEFPNGHQIPEGMQLNEITGEITWTPTEEQKGTYYIGLKIIAETEDRTISTVIPVFISVPFCEDLSTITINVFDENENPMDSAFAVILKIKDDINKPMNGKQNPVVNGTVEIDDIDAGTYLIGVYAYGYYENWYDDARIMYNATPVEIDCNDELEFDFYMEEVEMPDFYSLSGQVRDAETQEGIPYARVSIFTDDDVRHGLAPVVFTDEDGYYSFNKLPDNADYVVRAEKGIVTIQDGDSIYIKNYLPQYYDHVSDFSEATEIELTEDTENIDFDLERVPEYENSISGTLYGEDSVLIEEGFLVAFLVNTDDFHKGHMYYGITDFIEDGTFELDKLIPGEYVLVAFDAAFVYLPGYYVEGDVATMKWKDATRITVEEDSDVSGIEIYLPDRQGMWGGGIIRGRIARGEDGGIIPGNDEPALSGAMVFLVDENGEIVTSDESNIDGSFSIENVNMGSYKLVVDKIGFNSFETMINVDEEEEVIQRDVVLNVDILNSVEDNPVESAFVYPNPATDNISVSFMAESNNSIIKISDALGNVVIEKDLSTATGLNSINLDIKQLSAGAYYINISSGTDNTSIPFIVR